MYYYVFVKDTLSMFIFFIFLSVILHVFYSIYSGTIKVKYTIYGYCFDYPHFLPYRASIVI
jgi:hypothetical protein